MKAIIGGPNWFNPCSSSIAHFLKRFLDFLVYQLLKWLFVKVCLWLVKDSKAYKSLYSGEFFMTSIATCVTVRSLFILTLMLAFIDRNKSIAGALTLRGGCFCSYNIIDVVHLHWHGALCIDVVHFALTWCTLLWHGALCIDMVHFALTWFTLHWQLDKTFLRNFIAKMNFRWIFLLWILYH